MIIDQLFTPKPLQEGGPYDLPGKDYDRPGDTPRKQSSGEQNPYPYSPEEDDDYFREIFRKKREAKDQGVAEGPTDDPRFQKMMGNIQKSTPKYVPVTGYVAVSFASEQGSKKIKGVSRNGKPIPTNIGDPDQFLSGKIEFTPDQVEQQLMSIGKKYGWDSIDSGQSQGFTEMFFDTAKEYTSNNYPYLATNIVKTVKEINKFFADINKSLQTTGLPGYVSDVWQGMGPPENTNQIEDLDQIISIAKKTAPKADPGPEIGKVILANYERFGGEDGYSRSELDQAAKIAKIYITQGERAGFQAQHNSDVSDLIDELLSDAGSDVRTIYTDDPLNPMQIEDQGVAEKAGNLRPKLGNARDKGKSVRKWRNERGLNESKPLRNSQVYNPGHKSLSEALELYFGKNSKPISEGNRNDQLRLMEETTFRNGYAFARLLVEKNLTKDQVLQLFKDVEQGATAAGGNRTGLGKAKDATTQAIGSVQKMLSGARKWVKERPTYQAVDTEYNRAMTALGKVGGESGEANAVARAIYKYRDMAKKYPRATGLAKWAIISAAGFLTGGLGGVGVTAGLAAIDSALKDNEIVDIVKDAGYAAAVGGAIQGAGQLANMASDAYYGMPSASEIAANNAALGDFNDTDIPGGPASNINGLDLPGDAVPNVAGDTSPVPGEYSDAANNAYQQNPDPSDAPVDPNTRADYTQPGEGSSTYTVTADDFKGLGKIAQDNGLTAKELWDANPQITNPDKIFIGQEINIPAASGEPVQNVWQDWDGPTKPTAPAVEPGPGDTVPTLSTPSGGKIDYTAPGPESTDSLGQKLEYGIPVNDKGSFVPPNSSLPAEELAKQTAAYNSWLADFMKRFPNATPGPDGSMLTFKPGLAPMYPGMTPKTFESVKFKIIPAEQLIDQKLTVLSWALNESVNRKGQQSVQLTTKGVRTVFENIGRCRRAYLKEYIGAPTTDYGHPTAAGAPANATAGQGKPQGWFGKTLDTIGRGVDKVGSYASNVGHNIITKVTADKLNNMWNRAGEPYDSDRLYQLLTTEWGVPKEVVGSVFSKMSIPYTAPATAQPAGQSASPAVSGKAEREMWGGNLLKDPDTGKSYTVDKIQRGLSPAASATNTAATNTAPAAAATTSADTEPPPAATATSATAKPAAGTFPGEDPQGPGYVGRREVARRQAARDAEAAKKPAAPNFAQQGGGYKSVNYAPNIKTGINLPKSTAPAKPASTATLPAGGGAGVKAAAQTKPGFLQTATDKIAAKSKTQSMNSNDTQAEIKAGLAARRAAGLSAYESKTNGSRIFQALKRPVTEMLQMVETKEDVQKIKQFVDDTFIKYGAVNESAFAVRNRIIEHVTQTGAQRRREHSQRVAH